MCVGRLFDRIFSLSAQDLNGGVSSVQLSEYLKTHVHELNSKLFLNDQFLVHIRDNRIRLPYEGSIIFLGTIYKFGDLHYVRKLCPAKNPNEVWEIRWLYMEMGFGGDEAIAMAPPEFLSQ